MKFLNYIRKSSLYVLVAVADKASVRNRSHVFIQKSRYLSTTSSLKRNPRPSYWNINPFVMETDDWLHIAGKYHVCPWSLSGVESCIVVSTNDFTVAFDMGYAYPAAVKCQHVFISHGHMDHIGAIISHASKRGLYAMPPATYYIPPHLYGPLTRLAETYSEIHEAPIRLKLRPVDIDETVKLPGSILVKPFQTKHRVHSQGYLFYKVKKTLKAAYQGQASKAIGSLIKDGADIFDIECTPLLAYTGDTMSDIYDNPHNPDLLRVELLITESTYVDNEDKGSSTVDKARQRGHCHIDEIIAKEHLFTNVDNIVLVHFSDKYSTKYIQKQVDAKLTKSLKDKVHIGLVLKDKFDYKR